jgi:lipopolysaccharide biosynthesis regulator YciM
MRRWDSHAAVSAAVLVCAFPALALGGVQPWSITTTAAIAVAFFAFVFWRRVALERRALRLGWVGSAFLAATAVTALQLVPLPPGVLEVLSPKAHELLSFTLGDLKLYGDAAWHPLSLDPAATALELVRLCGLTAAYLAARNAITETSDARRVLLGVVIVGLVIVAIGVVHRATGATHIMGVHRAPMDGTALILSTFVNPNHMAGLVGISTCVALGLSLSNDESRNGRALLAFAAVVCAVGLVLTLSRAGIVALGATAVVLAFCLARGRAGKPGRLAWFFTLALAAGLAAAYFGSERLLREIAPSNVLQELETNLKVRMWQDTLPMLADFARAGVGKGAFASVFPLYQTSFAQYTHTHPENLPLQWIVDFGAAGAAVLALLMLRVGRLTLRRLSAMTIGAIAALWFVFLHNLADYNLEVSGVAYTAAIVLAVALRRESSVVPGPTARVWKPRTIVAGVALGGFLGALTFATPYALHHHKDRAVERVRAAPPDRNSIDQAARRELARHGADYLVFLSAAARLAALPTLDAHLALRYANRALYLNAPSYQTHLVTARILRRMGRYSQAAVEYRLASRRYVDVFDRVLAELAPAPDATARMREVAAGDAALQRRLARYFASHSRHAEALIVLGDLLELDPRDTDALSLAARAEAARGAVDAAQNYLARLAAIRGNTAEVSTLEGELLARKGDLAGSLEAFARARSANPKHAPAYYGAIEVLLQLRNGSKARGVLEALERVDVRAADGPRFALLMARAYELEGNARLALREYRHVLNREPHNAHARARADALSKELER